jgi:hypothetical protein
MATKGIVADLVKDDITLFTDYLVKFHGLEENNIKSIVTIHDLIFMHYLIYILFLIENTLF